MKQWSLFTISIGTILILFGSTSSNGMIAVVSGILFCIGGSIMLFKKRGGK